MRTLTTLPRWAKIVGRVVGVFILAGLFVAASVFIYLLEDLSKTFDATNTAVLEPLKLQDSASSTVPFPLGVNPVAKTITEQENVELYLEIHFASDYRRTKQITWLDNIYQKIAYLPWYQSLASPNSRVLVVFAGQRKEEVASNFSKILGWDKTEKDEFMELVTSEPVALADGTLFPGKYVTTPEATPSEVAEQLQNSFAKNVLGRYPHSVENILPLEEALTIASMIEREAGSFEDMQAISGVIWNRLFIDMKLQLDATLQYARGSKATEEEWWPVPVPKDKYINSPFNTYKNKGIPPSPIANPSAAAIIATLNPTKTNCLFYFHDNRKVMHCSETYEEHVAKLKKSFGTK